MNETSALQQVARLLGQFLIREADRELLERCHAPELSIALQELGLEIPEASEANVETLAEEYFRAFVNPEQLPPLVQSLVEEGRYDGAAAAAIRRLAADSGLEYGREAARGAPVDSLASELLMWADLSARAPNLADSFVAAHLRWALAPLRQRARRTGFYARVCAVTADLLEELSDQPE